MKDVLKEAICCTPDATLDARRATHDGSHDSARCREARVYFEYGTAIEAEIACLNAAIDRVPTLANRYNGRWLAIQLLEGDESLIAKVEAADRRSSGDRDIGRQQQADCNPSTARMWTWRWPITATASSINWCATP